MAEDTPQKSNASSKKKRKKWRPTAANEARRLGNTEDDWSFTSASVSSTTTRRQGRSSARRILVESTPAAEVLDSRPLLDGGANDESSVSSLTSSLDGGGSSRRPDFTRVIIEVKPMVAMLQNHLRCPECAGKLLVTFPTVCLASSCQLECTNKACCTWAEVAKPAPAKNIPLQVTAARIVRNTDFVVNVAYVLSFLASGDGGTEAGRLLGMLGLPRSTTMKSRNFGSIKAALSPVLQDFANEILMDNLKEEVKLYYGDQTDMLGNLLYDLWLRHDDTLTEDLWPQLLGCADMGWQQKGSGRKRNSQSGHAFIIAMKTRKVIAKALCTKDCGYCKSWRTKHTVDEPPPESHKPYCMKNHSGSSGSL